MIVRTLMTAATALLLAATTVSAQKVVSSKVGGGGSPHETVEWNVGGAKLTISRPMLEASGQVRAAVIHFGCRSDGVAATNIS